jgi:hypothetical protein
MRQGKPRRPRSGSPSTAGSSSSSTSRMTSDAGPPAYREPDDALDVATMATPTPAGGRCGRNTRDRLLGSLWQAVHGRLVGCEHVNGAQRLACDPVVRAVVGREGPDRPAASTSPMCRLETEWLARARPTWRRSRITPVPRSTGCTGAAAARRRPGQLQRPDLRRAARVDPQRPLPLHVAPPAVPAQPVRRPGALCPATRRRPHAEGWREVPELVLARCREQGLPLYARGNAGSAKPELYGLLAAEGVGDAVFPANQVLQERIVSLLARPAGWPPRNPQVLFAAAATRRGAGPSGAGWRPRSNGTRASCARGSGPLSPT